MYRSPSQSQDDFENFCTRSDILPNQISDELPICSIVTGDFNARCSRWWRNDITNFAGKEIDFLTSSAGYSQIIYKPTHVINKSKSRFDLIFYTNSNMISKYGVDTSRFDKCHHNVIYGQMNNHSHQSLFARFGTIVKQMFKIFKNPYYISIGEKILNLFLMIQRLTFLMKHYWTFLETISQIKKSNVTIANLLRWLMTYKSLWKSFLN